MPATDKTTYNQKTLHIVFAFSSVLLLLSTVWWLVVDHDDEFKEYQRNSSHILSNYALLYKRQADTTKHQAAVAAAEEALKTAREEAPSKKTFDAFIATSEEADKSIDADLQSLIDAVKSSYESFNKDIKPEEISKARTELFSSMKELVAKVKYFEDAESRAKKALVSKINADGSKYDISVNNHESADKLKKIKDEIGKDKKKEELMQQKILSLKNNRKKMTASLKLMEDAEENAKKQLDDANSAMARYQKSFDEQERNWFVRFMEWPIVDAFNGRLKPQQNWVTEIPLYNNFVNVDRFDRCITCHQALLTTEPGTAATPAFPPLKSITISLPSPKEPPTFDSELSADKLREAEKKALRNIYGLEIFHVGLLNKSNVTMVVFPQSVAAKAGMKTGDVLQSIGGGTIMTHDSAINRLLGSVSWGKPLNVVLRRGMPQPYSNHPRLDLYGTDGSPHSFVKFGCTICHDGQGSGTSFHYSSHEPNSVDQGKEWKKEHGWSHNHHWIFEQKPKRFLQSNCLKCHHNVVELESSERFPDPPAPKLVHGYKLIKKYGCFGCHEIKGFDGPNKRVGPDLRLEPGYQSAAKQLVFLMVPRAKLQLLQKKQKAIVDEHLENDAKKLKLSEALKALEKKQADLEKLQAQKKDKKHKPKITKQQIETAKAEVETAKAAHDALVSERNKHLARIAVLQARIKEQSKMLLLAAVLANDYNAEAERLELLEIMQRDIKRKKGDEFGPILTDDIFKLLGVIKSPDTPGTLRRTGPSLRYVNKKAGKEFLHDWIANPQNFRSSSKMPKFFGNHDHLSASEKLKAEKFEAIEIQAITKYLLSKSKKQSASKNIAGKAVYEYVPQAAGTLQAKTKEEKQKQIVRGRLLFSTRGCLACHSMKTEVEPYAGFTEAFEDDDLQSAISTALNNADQEQGPDLSQIGAKLSASKDTETRNGRQWLYTWLKNPNEYHSRTKMPNLFLDPIPLTDENGQAVKGNNGNIVMTDPAADITAYLFTQVDPNQTWDRKSFSTTDNAELDKLVLSLLKAKYRATVAKRYLQHGIPADERSTTAGAELELVDGDTEGSGNSDLVQRKLMYVGTKTITKYGCFACHDIPGFEDAKPIGTALADWGRKDVSKLAFEHISQYVVGDHNHQAHSKVHSQGSHAEQLSSKETEDKEYYLDKILTGRREGFIWQKLHEPRSFDYQKTGNKKFNEWLKMPKFPFQNDEEIEAIMTFVLGLVSEPAPEKYLYQPKPRNRAIDEGKLVLQKFNCAGCHVMSSEKITFRFKPDKIPDGMDLDTEYSSYPFLRKDFNPEQLTASKKVDYHGFLHATLEGLQATGSEGQSLFYDESSEDEWDPEDSDSKKAFLPLILYNNGLIDGKTFRVGVNKLGLKIPLDSIVKRYPVEGGHLARYMLPIAVAIEKPFIPTADGNAALAWVPPPLIDEGRKVQTEWLYQFLLDPHRIRPAVKLRMPKFNMSPTDARKIVDYFAAVDKVDYPYQFNAKTRNDYFTEKKKSHPHYLGDALNIVTNSNFCVKCHLIGDFNPAGFDSAKAPNLSEVNRRLRPDYVLRWIADPAKVLPYTLMPVNVQHGKPIDQKVFKGTAQQQVQGVADFLMNYNRYLQKQVPIAKKVKEAEAAAKAAADKAAANTKKEEPKKEEPKKPPQ